MWLSTTGSSALGQPSTNTARSEDSFRHPPTHRDYRRIRRPTRALPSRLLGGTRSPRSRTKSRVDFAALRVPKHTIKKHAPRETTNVPTPPSPSEELLAKYKSRHEERPWAQPPTPKARPKIPVAPTPPPPPPPPSPYSPNTKKSLLTVVKSLDAGLAAYFHKQRKHIKVGTSWQEFFELVDEDRSGRLTFDELAASVLNGTLKCKDLSRYDLRVFFAKADKDSSGEVTLREFTTLIYEVQLSAWPDLTDDACDKAVDILNQAASHWYRADGNWYKIFKALDVEDSGELKFDDFVQAVRGSYPPGVDVPSSKLSSATLRGLWKRLDNDRSQHVTLQEFMVFFRRHGQAHSMFKQTEHDKLLHGTLEKPEPPPSVESSDSEVWSTLRLLMRTLNAKNTKKKKYDKADIWRDWARLFDALGGPDRVTWAAFSSAAKALVGVEDQALAALWTKADDDKSGLMSYEELKKVLRTGYPGLEVTTDQVTDNDIRGLWRGLDDDLSGEVSVQEFMIFFRRHGREHSMFKPTDHDLASRGLLKGPEKVEKVELPPEKLRSIVLELKRNLKKYYDRRGMSPKLDEQWRVFFNTVDEDQSGRLDFSELKRAVKVLQVQLDDESLRGLFTAADEDGSGEITVDEFQHCVYKLELETWPDLSNKEELLQRAISVLNAHAEKWHRAGGNWYKIFKRIDADDSNTLAFEEFRHMCRSIYPGLNIDRKLLPDGLLRGLWRGIDADSSGSVTVQEFMVFMRAHAAHLDSMAGYTHRMHELASSQKVVEDTVNVEKGTGLRKLALLRDAALKFEVSEEPPVVAEWDFEALVRSMGLSENDLTADDCHAVWRAVAGRGEAYDRDGLLGWCRDPPVLKDGATDDEAPASPGAE